MTYVPDDGNPRRRNAERKAAPILRETYGAGLTGGNTERVLGRCAPVIALVAAQVFFGKTGRNFGGARRRLACVPPSSGGLGCPSLRSAPSSAMTSAAAVPWTSIRLIDLSIILPSSIRSVTKRSRAPARFIDRKWPLRVCDFRIRAPQRLAVTFAVGVIAWRGSRQGARVIADKERIATVPLPSDCSASPARLKRRFLPSLWGKMISSEELCGLRSGLRKPANSGNILYNRRCGSRARCTRDRRVRPFQGRSASPRTSRRWRVDQTRRTRF
jgi:hypothetical protein